MSNLRVTLKINPLSPSWLFHASWDGRVQDWIDTFQTGGWAVNGSPRIAATTALVYLTPRTGADVTTYQLAFLRDNWSDRVAGVSVETIEVVNDIPSVQEDQAALDKASALNRTLNAVGGALGATAKELAVPVIIIVAVGVAGYALFRALETAMEA